MQDNDGAVRCEMGVRETMPGYFDWTWPDGRVLAHNVPKGESPRLPKGWEWVDYRVAGWTAEREVQSIVRMRSGGGR